MAMNMDFFATPEFDVPELTNREAIAGCGDKSGSLIGRSRAIEVSELKCCCLLYLSSPFLTLPAEVHFFLPYI